MIGYNFFVEHAVCWRDNQGGIFPLSPPFKLAGMDESKARQIMKDHRALFLRWESDFDQIEEGGWWHIVKNQADPLETLPKKTRYMVRKAAREYEARPVDVGTIVDNGYDVYTQAYKRYNTHEPMFSRTRFCGAVKELPKETEFWGVYEKASGRLVAFSENYVEAETCFYVTMWIEPESLTKFAGYLLFHEMELHYLGDRGFKYISDGARSLSHDTNIHNFLISKFKFRKAFARLHVVYAPWIGGAVAITYPFRKWIEKIPLKSFKKVSILLRQEEVRRQCLTAVA